MATRIFTYQSPFAEENLRKSRHAGKPGARQCGVCGRATVSKVAKIHLVEGTHDCVAHPADEYADESADMGWWWVGRDCLKKLPAEFVLLVTQ